MRRFNKTLFTLALFLGAFALSPVVQARTLLSDAPFPWGTEIPLHWPALNGTWRAELGTSAPLILRFRVTERAGGIYLVTSHAIQQYRNGSVAAQGYAFVVSDQKHINIPYFGDGFVPLAILRKYPTHTFGPLGMKETLTMTWVWDANSPTVVHQHLVLEKISNESEL